MEGGENGEKFFLSLDADIFLQFYFFMTLHTQ